jgi:hypothetical protein
MKHLILLRFGNYQCVCHRIMVTDFRPHKWTISLENLADKGKDMVWIGDDILVYLLWI